MTGNENAAPFAPEEQEHALREAIANGSILALMQVRLKLIEEKLDANAVSLNEARLLRDRVNLVLGNSYYPHDIQARARLIRDRLETIPGFKPPRPAPPMDFDI